MKTCYKFFSLLIISSLCSCQLLIYPELAATCPSVTTDGSSYRPPAEETTVVPLKATNSAKEASLKANNANNDKDNAFFLNYSIGFTAQKPINEKLAVESGLFVSGKGNKSTFQNIENKLSLTYIDIPLAARYTFGDSKFSVVGGLQPSLLLGAKSKVDFGTTESEFKVTDNFKTLDMAALVGLGYQFNNGIRLNLGYDIGFLNANNLDTGIKLYNRNLKFKIGYQLNKK